MVIRWLAGSVVSTSSITEPASHPIQPKPISGETDHNAAHSLARQFSDHQSQCVRGWLNQATTQDCPGLFGFAPAENAREEGVG
jgi:hypothetical protein